MSVRQVGTIQKAIMDPPREKRRGCDIYRGYGSGNPRRNKGPKTHSSARAREKQGKKKSIESKKTKRNKNDNVSS